MTLEESQARIAALEIQLAERDVQLAERDAQLAVKDLRIAELEAQVQILTEQVAVLLKQGEVLTERLGQNSRNSHRPPSSDLPGRRARGKAKGKGKAKSKRKRGGQKGHKGSHRELMPAEQVDKFVNLFPPACENCAKTLPEVPDIAARRYQHVELPPIKPYVTEVRRHTVTCPCCQHETCADHDDVKIPASPFGPRLMATIALLTGVYHLSRRTAAELLSQLLGLHISLGALSTVEGRVSNAIAPAVDEAWDVVEQADVKHTDGTSWLQSGVTLSLWTLTTAMATVFKVVSDGSKKTLRKLFGEMHGILVSDRAAALNFWAMEFRQICWSHLIRKFVSFSERDGPAAKIGRELLGYTAIFFEYWHDYKDGKLSREQLRTWMAPLQAQMEALLERAVNADISRLSGSCADILKHRQALWTFIEHDDVGPTNNDAERALRAFVLWRKRSFGTQSERGNRFAERIMTVAQTAKSQGKNILAFLTACCEAQRANTTPPSLFASGAADSADVAAAA